ncbi:MAG: hypothetical protein FWF07_01220, partial [Methanomassiliicoccaceae archaeon]|nr:hypothetical protein [Methanomassiliicoccaceae archaeon]
SGVILAEVKYDDEAFKVGADEELSIRADDMTDYDFLRWYDDNLNIIAADTTDETIGCPEISDYIGSVTFTAVYQEKDGTTSQVILVTLETEPDTLGAKLWYTITTKSGVTLTETEYDGDAFKVGVDETLTIRADDATGYDFLRWYDDLLNIIAPDSTDDTVGCPDMTDYTGTVTFTAVYQERDGTDASQVILVTLASVPDGAELWYTITTAEGVELNKTLYTKPFKVGLDEALVLEAGDLTGYEFLRWDDGKRIISFLPETGEVDLSLYDGSAKFTANYELPEFIVNVTLESTHPGADLYYKIGDLDEILYVTAFNVSMNESLTIRADDLTGYEFLRWDDKKRIISHDPKAEDVDLSVYDSGSVTFVANYALEDDTLTVTLAGPGGADLFYTIGDLDEELYSGPFKVSKDEELSLRAGDLHRHTFKNWSDGTDTVSDIAETGILDLSGYEGPVRFTAYYLADELVIKDYYITATQDSGSEISPVGISMVPYGSDKKYTFSAKPGYRITAVYVDGVAISPEEMASGEYTFTYVMSNHTISVVSVSGRVNPDAITLTIEIVGGTGTPKYRVESPLQREQSPQTGASSGGSPRSLSDAPYISFIGTQIIQVNIDLYASLDVDKGYRFVEWTGDVRSTDLELFFPDVDTDIYLIAHLEAGAGPGDGGWAVLNLVFAVFAVLIGIIAIIAGRGRLKKDNDEKRGKIAMILRLLALIIGVVSIIVFFITEDLSLSLDMTDEWTLLMAVLFVVGLIMAVFSFRFDVRKEDEARDKN